MAIFVVTQVSLFHLLVCILIVLSLTGIYKKCVVMYGVLSRIFLHLYRFNIMIMLTLHSLINLHLSQ